MGTASTGDDPDVTFVTTNAVPGIASADTATATAIGWRA